MYPTFSKVFPALCVCVMIGGPPACISSDNGVGFKAMGPCVSEGGGEREGLTGTEGDDNAVSSQSHLMEIEKEEEGERRWMEVAAPVME